jgi:nucleoside-diphosphate-sugar epimerase
MNIPLPVAHLVAFLSEIGSKISKTPTPINRYKLIEMKQTHWIANIEKAAENLAFHPKYSLQEAIQETVDWYLKQGWM